MAPKGHRAPALVRAHSRSSSATKLPANLQFTQKKAPPRPKQQQHQQQQPAPKQRPGFHIASPGEEEEEEEWVSSESGAVTPNPHNEDDSDLESAESNERQPDLHRVTTARLSDYYVTRPEPEPPTRAPEKTTATTTPPRRSTGPDSRMGIDTRASQAPSPSRRRQSRPMSTHSTIAKPELRPHPLIRGQSFGQPNLTPKPSPLLPVAVTRDADVAGQLSTSPSASSPTSSFPSALTRRTSISSARSVATVATPHPPPRSVREARHRTFSTLSTASSSAALSSLTHLPTVSRPPTPQMIAFFPPLNPHVHLDAIHPFCRRRTFTTTSPSSHGAPPSARHSTASPAPARLPTYRTMYILFATELVSSHHSLFHICVSTYILRIYCTARTCTN
ncbi:hypothetical protein B0H17DRAFT_1201471 [Mycena rosella]|uniref:Uncharacterized protein n=1 Tax=Mycena rosella TaxID=1033263 RepID=A0AAD7DG45_MYCRO|nr:hypothetical protein B0H17DRAFT_1201471 [Mycena rosella]